MSWEFGNSRSLLRLCLLMSSVAALLPATTGWAETDEEQRQREHGGGQAPAQQQHAPAQQSQQRPAPQAYPQRPVEQSSRPATAPQAHIPQAGPPGRPQSPPPNQPAPQHIEPPRSAAPLHGDSHEFRGEGDHGFQGGDHGFHGRDDHGFGGEERHHDEMRFEFHEHEAHRLDPYEYNLWRGGAWNHGWHDGRLGWWWFVGGTWYFYDQPVYPYPDIISDYTVVEPDAPDAPVVVEQAPPQAYAPAYTGTPPALYYYCSNPPGIYPTVARCSTPFVPVYYYCDNPAGYYPGVPNCAVPFRLVPVQTP